MPVFNHDKFTKNILILDFFAGSGTDAEGNLGSPLVLLDKAKGDNRKYCSNIKKPTKFIFNEAVESKSKQLGKNVNAHIIGCCNQNGCGSCSYSIRNINYEFKDVFSDEEIKTIFNDKEWAKFVLLDQYGFKEIDKSVFQQLISYPKTDFIFFISSSFISRFRAHENTKRYIDTEQINFDDIKPNEINRAIAKYFKDLIPDGEEYYLHHFSIQKATNKGNYYGLIFGSKHSLGMEKFLKVCWKHDNLSGEANYNIDNNFEEYSLFYEPHNAVRKEKVRKLIKDGILTKEIVQNRAGLKFVMNHGCEPKLFTEVVKELEKEGLIERFGNVNNSSSNIHKAEIYHIRILNNE